MTTSPLRARVVSGLFWSALQSWGLKLLSVVVFTIIARLLTPAEVGLFAFVTSVIGFMTIFADQGLSEAVVQQPTITQDQVSGIFVVNVGVALLLFTGLWFLAPVVAGFVHLPSATNVLRVVSLTLCIGATYFSQAAMLRRNFQYRWLAIAAFASSLAASAVALILAFTGFGVWSLVAQSLAGSAFTAVLLWSLPQWRFKFRVSFSGVRGPALYGINRLGANLLDYANSRCIDLFVITALGPAALGLYSVGMRLQQSLMQGLSGAVLDVAHNAFSRLAADREALLNGYYKAQTVTAAVAVPVFVLVAALAPELVLLLFGTEYAGAALVLRPMSILGAIQAMQFYNGTAINACGKPSIALKFLVLKSVVTLAALWLGRGHGLEGLVAAFVFSQLATTPVSFYLAHRLIGVSVGTILARTWRFLVGCALAWLAIAGGRALLSHADLPALLRVGLLLAVGSISYATFLGLAARHQVLGLWSVVSRPQPSS